MTLSEGSRDGESGGEKGFCIQMVTLVGPHWSLQLSVWSGSWNCDCCLLTVPFVLWGIVWAPTTGPLVSASPLDLVNPLGLSGSLLFPPRHIGTLDPQLTAHRPGEPGNQTLRLDNFFLQSAIAGLLTHVSSHFSTKRAKQKPSLSGFSNTLRHYHFHRDVCLQRNGGDWIFLPLSQCSFL